MSRTIWNVLHGDNLVRDLSSARGRVDPGWRDYTQLMTAMCDRSGLLPRAAGEPDQTALARAFERYNDEVRQAVPGDRLLVWSPADGWDPLCEFLDVPVPQAPLPRANDSAMFNDRIIGASLAALGEWYKQRN